MRHRVAGRHLNRTSSHRRALRRNLAASLIEHGAIRTTRAKAKEVQPFVERLVTVARKGTLHARRRVIAMLQDRAMVNKDNRDELDELTVVRKLFEEVAPRFADRPGGYTRIIRLPERRIGDGGEQVLLQLVEAKAPAGGEAPATASARRRHAARRAEAAKALEQEVQPDRADRQGRQAAEGAEDVGEPAEGQAEARGQEAPDQEDRDAGN